MVRVIVVQVAAAVLHAHRFQLIVLYLDGTRNELAPQVGARRRQIALFVGVDRG